MHKVLLCEGLIEIEFYALFALFYPFDLLFGLIFGETYLHKLFNGSFEIADLYVFIRKWMIEAFYVRITTWISDFECQRKQFCL